MSRADDKIATRLRSMLSALAPTQNATIIVVAVGIGILAGFGNVLFRKLIHLFHTVIFEGGSSMMGLERGMPWVMLIVLLPLTGAALIVLLDMVFPGKVRGYGLPRFLETIHLRGAVFRIRTTLVKSVASAITIGSGGSAGTEGPIATIGGTIGSVVGQMLGVSSQRMRTLVACGVAGGVAGTFNAPIAGVFFAHEIVLLGSFEASEFTPVVLSSGVGVLVTRALQGNHTIFTVPEYVLSTHWEAVLFPFLGIAAGFVGIHFTRSFYYLSDAFHRVSMPDKMKPLVGALATGIVGIFLPQVLGDGYEQINLALAGNMAGYLVLLLAFAKIYCTGLTLGSGNAGGVFAPALFIGAMLGGAFGASMEWLVPSLTTDTGLYALAGMGGVLAAATHAPMTAIFLIFEMTDEYSVILPIMFTCVIAYAISKHFESDSIDTLELTRRGIHLEGAREITILRSILVADVMTRDIEVIPETMPLKKVLQMIPGSRQVTFPLVDSEGLLSGIISLQDFREVAYEESLQDLVVAKELGHDKVVTLFPDQNLQDALSLIGYRMLEHFPVVERNNPKRILGMLNHQDILAAYNKAILRMNTKNH